MSQVIRSSQIMEHVPVHEAAPDDPARAWQVHVADEVFVVISLPLADAVSSRAERDSFAMLTSAERDIAAQILRGASNKQIAQRRGTSARTVANQIAAIYQKLAIASRAELAARIARRGAR